MTDFPDHTILQIALSDRAKAFELAFIQYWEITYNHAYRKLQSGELAKDMVQEVFITLWNNLDKLAGQETIMPYLYGVLRNKILQIYEKDEVRLRYAMSVAKQTTATELSAEEILQQKELQILVKNEIEKMPDRMKTIYLLKKEEDLSIKEIAVNLNISEQTVKNQLQQAYHRLKSCLNDYDPSVFFTGLAFSWYFT